MYPAWRTVKVVVQLNAVQPRHFSLLLHTLICIDSRSSARAKERRLISRTMVTFVLLILLLVVYSQSLWKGVR